MAGGSWRAPERVDAGIETAATEAQISTTDNQRFAVTFISGGRLYGSVVPEGGGPLPAAQLLYADADPLRAISDLSFDMGINGAAYATFTAPGAGGSDVRAVRLQDTSWETIAAPLDVDPNQTAGAGKGRSQVAVAADGNAVVVYGETHPDGRYRIYGRRVTGINPSVIPQEVSLPELGGQPGGNADSAEVMIEEDVSYAWAVWRQDFGGVSRTVTRRLVGSLWEAPVAIDGGAPSADPQIGMNGRGVGFTVSRTDAGTVMGTPLDQRRHGRRLAPRHLRRGVEPGRGDHRPACGRGGVDPRRRRGAWAPSGDRGGAVRGGDAAEPPGVRRTGGRR